MQILQHRWAPYTGWEGAALGGNPGAQLLLVFGGGAPLRKPSVLDELRAAYPAARVFGCSTAGEIAGVEVTDDHLVATAVRFDRTRIDFAKEVVEHPDRSADVGGALARRVSTDRLVHVFVLSDGLVVLSPAARPP